MITALFHLALVIAFVGVAMVTAGATMMPAVVHQYDTLKEVCIERKLLQNGVRVSMADMALWAICAIVIGQWGKGVVIHPVPYFLSAFAVPAVLLAACMGVAVLYRLDHKPEGAQ